jgi:hypothetical protein
MVKARKGQLLGWIKDHATHTRDECLKWPFNISADGYGRVNYPDYKGTKMTASRVMCIIAHGNPPSERHEAAHSCGNGNKGCVNPRHLRWATKAQNERDKILHGTSNRGHRQHKSKLTQADVQQIRAAYPEKKQQELADEYGIDQSTVSDIVRRRRWAWLE